MKETLFHRSNVSETKKKRLRFFSKVAYAALRLMALIPAASFAAITIADIPEKVHTAGPNVIVVVLQDMGKVSQSTNPPSLPAPNLGSGWTVNS
jgi:hypothetical protein